MPIPNPSFGTSGFGTGGYGNQPIESLPIGYYLNLLTSEYTNSPKLNAFLKFLLQKFDDVTQCMAQMDYFFDLDNATGDVLDTRGAIAGVSRTVSFQPSNGVSPILDDTTYRILIKAQIANDGWDGTIGSLQGIWKQLFPDGNITIGDNQDMTATIFLTGAFTSIIQDLITNGYIVPRPQGVLYNFVFGTLPVFGFGSSPGYIAGFGEGHWN